MRMAAHHHSHAADDTFHICHCRSWQKGINRVVVWSFDNMYSDEKCWEYFRFRKEDMPHLLHELRLPTGRDGRMHTRSRYVFEPMEALCTFLHRMAHPSTWDVLIGTLGGSSTARYKDVFYMVLDYLFDTFQPCINDICRWEGNSRGFAGASVSACTCACTPSLFHVLTLTLPTTAAIHAAGAPAPRCIGFIDGTFRPCARPVRGQRQVYNGYPKTHGIKFQSVIGPHGLIIDLLRACLGRRGDGWLLAKSGLLQRMAALVRDEASHFYVYGDTAYALSQYVLRGFKGAMTPAQRAFSTAMSRLRETVEWGFALVLRDWAFLDRKKNLKLFKQPIGKLFYVGALLANIKTCLTASHALDGYGNQIALKFGVSPPSLHDYLHRF